MHFPNRDARHVADHIIEIPRFPELLAPIVEIVPLQLLAYYTAVLADQLRTLAKSVTVVCRRTAHRRPRLCRTTAPCAPAIPRLSQAMWR